MLSIFPYAYSQLYVFEKCMFSILVFSISLFVVAELYELFI